jgi:hypothetical protein
MRVLKSGPREVDTVGTAVSPEHPQVVPGAAAAVENLEPPAAGGSGNERFNEPPEAPEPEMIAFGARRGFKQAIHEC